MIHPVFSEALSNLEKANVATSNAIQQRKFEPICKPGISMDEAPLEPHVTGSRPRSCFQCLRAQENAR